ncbi:hypothetical protein FQR65_LT01556 [Abscondita terminalis]|nr:hypothetical protein FQR65_LT01556 [Abscondita terminalis]
MPPVFTCCVVNCDADAKNTRKHPKDPVLFRKWIEFSQRTNLENMDVEKVRNNYRICDYHFAPEYMVGVQHFSISSLVTGAIPTLNSSSYVELDIRKRIDFLKVLDVRRVFNAVNTKIQKNVRFSAQFNKNWS